MSTGARYGDDLAFKCSPLLSRGEGNRRRRRRREGGERGGKEEVEEHTFLYSSSSAIVLGGWPRAAGTVTGTISALNAPPLCASAALL